MRPVCVLLLAGIPAVLWGQATVEYGLAAAAAGTAGAANQTGKSIAGVFSKLGKSVGASQQAQPASAKQAPPSTKATVAAEPAAPAVVYEDPDGITAGMQSAELLRRFGEPSFKITSGPGRESLTYQAKDRVINVEMRDGKVASVQSKTKAKQSAVVVVQ